MALAVLTPEAETLRAPRSAWELFRVFNTMALQGFGGVLPVVERVLVHERRWMNPKDFVESFAIAQALPGPPVINLSLMLGDRFMGTRGALAAFSGVLCLPMVLVLSLTTVYQAFAELAVVQNMLLGMGAVAVGMIAGIGLRLARTQGHYRVGWAIGLGTFVAMAMMHMKLAMVLLLFGLPSFALRYWQLRQKALAARPPPRDEAAW